MKKILIGTHNKGKFKEIAHLLSKKLKNFLQKKFKIQKYKVFLSLSDEKDYSIAFVVIDKKI